MTMSHPLRRLVACQVPPQSLCTPVQPSVRFVPRDEAGVRANQSHGPEDLRSGCASPVKHNALMIVVALSVELLTL